MPFELQITAPASLTWLPPPNTSCVFNYTVNITNSSCSMTVYSSSTSLILTDLLTRGQNYSFAVAVTDSTGQHGPWSDQLMVTLDGKIILLYNFNCFHLHIIMKVPKLVTNVSWTFNQSNIIVDWEVSNISNGLYDK